MSDPILYRIRRKLVHASSPYIPLGLYQRWQQPNPIGFMYHIVSDADLPHVKHLYPYKSTAEFEADLIYLKANYSLVGYPELLAHFQGEQPLPANAAYLSFDDGFVECYTAVFPLLQKHNIPGLFFLATDWVDNQDYYYRICMSLAIEKVNQMPPEARATALQKIGESFAVDLPSPATFRHWVRHHQRYDLPKLLSVCELLAIDVDQYVAANQPFMTRAQVQEMHAAGQTFGGHTSNHTKLHLLPPEQQQREIIDSCRWVAELVGEESVPFAFPFSGDQVNREMLADLKNEHGHVGLIFDTKRFRADADFVCHRIWVDQPVRGVRPQDNLKHWVHDAYARALRERVA